MMLRSALTAHKRLGATARMPASGVEAVWRSVTRKEIQGTALLVARHGRTALQEAIGGWKCLGGLHFARFIPTVLAACDAADNPLSPANRRPRLRDLGVVVGVLPTGPANSLTDVAGVQVGHRTIVRGDSVRTGVTVVKPHTGNLFLNKSPAAVHVANGFGKLVGATQVEELGVLESPIVLTNTLSAFAAADAVVGWTLAQPGCQDVRSVNPLVGECNDGYLNDIRGRHVSAADVKAALRSAHGGPVLEGCVGAGTGVRCMGWKGGIGSSSRKLPPRLGGYTVGVLVQTNFGGTLTVAGAPVGRALGRYYLKRSVESSRGSEKARDDEASKKERGSCIVVVATDAPLDARRLQRLARRAPLGLAAVGSPMTHGSGDYVIAFSTAAQLRTPWLSQKPLAARQLLRDEQLSPLFQAVKDATEEAVVNSMLQAVSVTGYKGHRVEAIDPQQVAEVCRRFGAAEPVKAERPAANALALDEITTASAVRTYGKDREQAAVASRVRQLQLRLPHLMQRHRVPGVAVAVVSQRKLTWARGFGIRRRGEKTGVDPDTVMEACSMSKPFFSYLVLQLIEQRQFDLDRRLVSYLGRDYLPADARGRAITGRMTLTHTSGLPNWRSGGWRTNSPLSLAFEPGARFRYSGEGYLMLQRAVEAAVWRATSTRWPTNV